MARHHNVPDLEQYFTARHDSEEQEVTNKIPALRDKSELLYSDQELQLVDTWATEQLRLCGTDIRYYSLDLAGTVIDPVYSEPIARKYLGPYLLRGLVSTPFAQPTVQPEGFLKEISTDAWIARLEFEKAKCPEPKEEDILEFWSIPYFQRKGAAHRNPSGLGYFFTVLRVAEDGHLFDSSSFVGFTFELKRNTKALPEENLTSWRDTVGTEEFPESMYPPGYLPPGRCQ